MRMAHIITTALFEFSWKRKSEEQREAALVLRTSPQDRLEDHLEEDQDV
jgi:hypothetical protein